MSVSGIQTSLFEEDYLLRELGQVAHVPHVALTELVANSWDAGATEVILKLPEALEGLLTVEDNGHGMSPADFKKRWMTLRYNRIKHQGDKVEFPGNKERRPRKAYGRNGVGRHGLLCFGDEYIVETWRDGVLGRFRVGSDAGDSPFVLREETIEEKVGNGTRLSVVVSRKLPDADEILTVLSARFVHDPEFVIRVNGKIIQFHEMEGIVREKEVQVDPGHSAKIIVIDSTKMSHSSLHQGIAFWVQKRLVGSPSWSVGQIANFDGRTRFARRYKVIVDTSGYENDVEQDWSGFKKNESVKALYTKIAEEISEIAYELSEQVMEESSADALSINRNELSELGLGARLEVSEFTKTIAKEHPTISPDFLSTAVKAVINLEKSKSGSALLEKLSTLDSSDVEGLDQLLSEWSVKDALRVLDEIDSRLSVIETIGRLADDPNTDELHTLHPLVLRSRWLFGPEFESQEYCSNRTLKTVAKELFKNSGAQFINEKNRPDIVSLPESTSVQLTGIETFDMIDPAICKMDKVLLIELKRGGFQLTREEINQADGYVQDIAMSGSVTGRPFISAWVVGQTIAPGVAGDKVISDNSGEFGRVRAATFGSLVDTANRRLLKLRDILSERYGDIHTDSLLEKVFALPDQQRMDLQSPGES